MRFTYMRLLTVLYFPTIIAMGVLLKNEIEWARLLLFTFVLLIYGIGWDIWSTKHGRSDRLWIWRFNRKTLTGEKISRHPIEEYIFGICHLFWVVLFWENLHLATTRGSVALLVLLLVMLWMLVIGRNFYRSQSS